MGYGTWVAFFHQKVRRISAQIYEQQRSSAAHVSRAGGMRQAVVALRLIFNSLITPSTTRQFD